MTRWGKLRAFFYAKNKFDARARSFRRKNNNSKVIRGLSTGGTKEVKGQEKGQGQMMAVSEDLTESDLKSENESELEKAGQINGDRDMGQGESVFNGGEGELGEDNAAGNKGQGGSTKGEGQRAEVQDHLKGNEGQISLG